MYCDDSIYSKHLQTVYKRRHDSKIKKLKSYRKRSKERRRIAHLARFEAHKKLSADLGSNTFSEFPIQAHPRVVIWISYFHSPRGRVEFIKWLRRGELYKPLVYRHLRNEGLPKELYYLAMIESGFNNAAYSRARAAGAWQFIAATAKAYGLKVNYWVDERRDPNKATIAASRYLKQLHKKFKNWYLSVAAYNAGPGKINYARRKTRSRDFWRLSSTRFLKKETKHYIPKLLATYEMASNPKKFGFKFLSEPKVEDHLIQVNVEHPVHLREIAGFLNISLDKLKRWNPEIRRNVTPPPSHPGARKYTLNITPDLEERFYALSPELTELKIRNYQTHKIRQGDTIESLAKKYRVPVRTILSVNPNIRPRVLRVGKHLTIPIPKIAKSQSRKSRG